MADTSSYTEKRCGGVKTARRVDAAIEKVDAVTVLAVYGGSAGADAWSSRDGTPACAVRDYSTDVCMRRSAGTGDVHTFKLRGSVHRSVNAP